MDTKLLIPGNCNYLISIKSDDLDIFTRLGHDLDFSKLGHDLNIFIKLGHDLDIFIKIGHDLKSARSHGPILIISLRWVCFNCNFTIYFR